MTVSILPKNERKVAVETPRNFVIFGGTMHGKTYFADEFPNPLNLNTDGNAEMIETPSLSIRNERDTRGNITKPASEHLVEIINELENGNHTFETVVIDVIDDIITLFEQEITEAHKVKSVADISWGKGHQMLEMMVRVLVMRLKELTMKTNMNVLYLSRLNTIVENDVERYVPSLKLKWMNIVNGNSDYTILCRKIGKNYIRRVDSKRKNYTRDRIDDERIAKLLDTVSGAYDRSRSTSKKEQEAIVQEEEKQQQAERLMRQRERDQVLEEDKPKVKNKRSELTGTKCAECGEPQFNTPSGITCKNGHGGADSKEQPQSKQEEPAPRPRRRRRRVVTN